MNNLNNAVINVIRSFGLFKTEILEFINNANQLFVKSELVDDSHIKLIMNCRYYDHVTKDIWSDNTYGFQVYFYDLNDIFIDSYYSDQLSFENAEELFDRINMNNYKNLLKL